MISEDDSNLEDSGKAIPPERMKQALAEREKIARWGASNGSDGGSIQSGRR